MSNEELTKLLGLNIAPIQVKGEKTQSVAPTTLASEPISDTALKLDAWDLARGGEVAKYSPHKTTVDKPSFADLHGCLYKEDPELNETCTTPRRLEFIKALMESPDYRTLRQNTLLDQLASETATNELAGEYAKLVEKDSKAAERRKRRRGRSSGQKENEQESEALLNAAAYKGAKRAQEKIDELFDSAQAVGLGRGANGQLDSQRVANVYHKVKNNAQLHRICELAGRYRRVAQGKQRVKTTHGYGDVVGIKLDDTIENILEEELALLLIPTLQLDTLRRLSEREMLAFDRRDEEKIDKGPICVVVDESGSMSGEPVCNAKAFALALAWIAKHQKRYCLLVSFSSSVTGNYCVLPPNKWDENKLLDWLGGFMNGGTTHHVLCETLPNQYWNEAKVPKGRTDIFVISDAVFSIPPEVRDNFNLWRKKEQAKVTTLLIGSPNPGPLAEISDEVHLISQLGADNAVVGSCLSV